jgi:phosphoribosyl-ATP pyrophosphohydrolase
MEKFSIVGVGFSRLGVRLMKAFETLFEELKDKAQRADPDSGTVQLLGKGPHAIGKKLVEEAAEVWMAARYEGREQTAEEISQLLYHAQVMMLANGLELEDVYRYL